MGSGSCVGFLDATFSAVLSDTCRTQYAIRGQLGCSEVGRQHGVPLSASGGREKCI